jgi:hypothetical protein
VIASRYLSVAGNASVALSSMYAAILFAIDGRITDYGYFAFFLLMQAFACGIINGLVNTPHFESAKSKVQNFRYSCNSTFFIFSIVLSVFAAALIAIGLALIGASHVEAVIAGTATFFYCIRWHLRSVFNTVLQARFTYTSDFIYSFLFCTALTLAYLISALTIYQTLLSALIASLASFFYCIRLFVDSINLKKYRFRADLLKNYFIKFGWVALSGVVATEFLSNYVSYLITYKFGPELFSIVALSMMLFRPIMIVSASLIQSERAHLRLLVSEAERYKGLLYKIAKIVSVIGVINFIIAILFVKICELYDFFGVFNYQNFMGYSLVFTFVFAARCTTSILSLDLQARGHFNLISKITVVMACVSVLSISIVSLLGNIYFILLTLAFIELVTSLLFFYSRQRVYLCKY